MCDKHEYPLVMTPHDTPYKCQYKENDKDITPCLHKASMECVEHKCSLKLCQRHFNLQKEQAKTSENGVVRMVHVGAYQHTASAISSSVHQDNATSNIVHQDEESGIPVDTDDADIETNLNGFYVTTADDTADDEDNAIFEHNNVNDFVIDPFVDGEDDEALQKADSDDEHLDIPTTLAGEKGTDYHLTSKYPNNRIHAMVVINGEGGCLLRRGTILDPTLKEKGFLQRIMATHEGSIPLLYPEAMLFPSIFWYELPHDGGIMGALPGALWTDERRAGKFNFAGVESHIRSRIKNNRLLCSTDPRYMTLCCDILSNIKLRGKNATMILKRGYETLYEENSGIRVPNESNLQCNRFVCEVVDSRRSVNCLSSLFRDHQPGIFHTHTLNQQYHPGPKEISAFLEYEENHFKFDRFPRDPRKEMEYSRALHQAAAIHIYRSYIKVVESLIDWIVNSDDPPLTEIEGYFIIRENQEEEKKASGICPHFHMCLCLKKDINNEEVLDEVRQKIRCSRDTLLDDKDIKWLFLNKIIENEKDDVIEIRALGMTLLVHLCSAARYRCQRVGRDGNKYCRNVNYATENANLHAYGYKKFPLDFYNEEVRELFVRLNFVTENEQGVITGLDARLESGIHVYPTTRAQHFQPVVTDFFSIFKSSMNTRICDRSMCQRYLCNYCGTVDKRAYSHISANKETGNPEVEIEMLANTKVPANRIADEKKSKEKNKKNTTKVQGSIIGLTQVFGHLLKSPEVYCSESFVSIPSLPLEDRRGVKTTAHFEFHKAADAKEYVHQTFDRESATGIANVDARHDSVRGREALKLPTWRQFNTNEQMILRDQLCAHVSMDNLTWFSIRPPELRCINMQRDYIQCFFWKKIYTKPPHEAGVAADTKTEHMLKNGILWDSPWIDGVERRIYIRRKGIEMIISKYGAKMCPEVKLLFHSLYHKHHGTYHHYCPTHYQEQIHGNINLDTFLHKDDAHVTKLPLCVIAPIKPTRSNKFIIHLILSMGTFSNEVDLWGKASTIADVFYNAKLLRKNPSVEAPTSKDVDLILAKYIDEQLFYLPIAMSSIQKYALQAHYILTTAIISNSLPDMGMPGYLYTSLYRSGEEDCEAYLMDLKTTLINKLIDILPRSNSTNPSVEDFLNATKEKPLNWNPTIVQLHGQSEQSFHEQKEIFQFLKRKIDQYVQGSFIAKRGTILHGPPGAGKTFIQNMSILYAISKGLCGVNTSLAARRSHQLGGKHIAEIFRLINTSKDDATNTEHLTDSTLLRVYRHPMTLNLLRVLDIIGLDEGGLDGSELISSLDMITRIVRGSPDFLGYILMMITLDVEQCSIVDRRQHPILTSPNIITSFDVIDFQGFVRSRNDDPQQQLIRLFQKGPVTDNWNEDDIAAFKNIVKDNCTFVKKWTDRSITIDTLCIFGKHAAVDKAEKLFIERHIHQRNIPIITRPALDEQSVRAPLEDGWYPSCDKTSKHLTKVCKMPATLYLYEHGVVEMTFNNATKWDQGRLAILRHLPNQDQVNQWNPLTVFIADATTNLPPPNHKDLNDKELMGLGWTKQIVKPHTSDTQSIKGGIILGRRTQYPLRSRNASTIHKIIGDTLLKGATEVSDDRNSPYYIWERGLVVVLLTRFESLKNLTFVGQDKDYIVNVLLATLDKCSEYYEFTKNILKNVAITFPLSNEKDENDDVQRPEPPKIPSIILDSFPYRPKDFPLPSKTAAATGFVYFLMSTKDRNYVYIGQADDLKKRLQQHNQGIRHKIADPKFRPWALLMFYTGFETDNQRRSFEQQWIRKRIWHQHHHGKLTISDIIALGNGLCAAINQRCSSDARIICHKCYTSCTVASTISPGSTVGVDGTSGNMDESE